MKTFVFVLMLTSCIAHAEVGSVLAEIVSIDGEPRSGTIIVELPVISVAQPQPEWESEATATPNEVLYGWAIKGLPLFNAPGTRLVYPVQ